MISKNWQELIKPSKVQIEPGHDPASFAQIVVEPLERGFGITLGNALRRVLLSSLQGAAITAVKIDGVVHEFDSINGVKEDIVDVVLNLKGVIVRLNAGERKRAVIDVTGPCAITAGMIDGGAEVEVVNKDHVLCTLNEGEKFYAELTIETGKGYVPASQNRHGLY